MASSPSYSVRYVVFLDILGFRELIQESVKRRKTFLKICSLISNLTPDVKQVVRENDAFEVANDIRITQFSDTIIVSVPVPAESKSISGLFIAVEVARRLEKSLLLDFSVLCRGSIVKGKIFHGANQIFGPALVEAYRLESEVADVPRIVLAKDVAAEWSRYYGQPGGMNALVPLVQCEASSVKFLDAFFFPEGDTIDRETRESTIRAGIILEELSKKGRKEPRIERKIKWLREKYLRSSIKNRVSKLR